MTWDPELAELARRTELAARLGGAERVERQHATGRLTVRERIDLLLDEGSWRETGTLTGSASYAEDGTLLDVVPANSVTGAGRIAGRRVVVAGPAVVDAGMGESVDKETLGGWRLAARAGTVDLVADTEEGAFDLVGRVLSYLPQHSSELPPVVDCTDPLDRRDETLRSLVPRERRSPYDVRALLAAVFDEASVLELGRLHAPSTVTALARLGGLPVAVLASDPNFYGGGMTADGADKMARFVDLAGTFRLPVVHLVDQPGFVIGSAAEAAGVVRHGARALAAVEQSTMPWASVLVRRCFGVAGAGHRPLGRWSYRIAWPSGDWGSLPVEGGLEVAFKRLLAESPDAAALKDEIAARLEAVRSPFRTAEAFLVEEIVDPADTRPLLCEWAAQAYATLASVAPHRGTRP